MIFVSGAVRTGVFGRRIERAAPGRKYTACCHASRFGGGGRTVSTVGGWAFRGAAVYAFGHMKFSSVRLLGACRLREALPCCGSRIAGFASERAIRGNCAGRRMDEVCRGAIAGFGRWAGRPVLGGLWPGGAAVRGRSGLYRSIRLAFRVAIFRLTGAGTPSGTRDLCRGCCRPDRKMPCRTSVHSSTELLRRDHPFGGFFERRIVH